MSYLKKLKERRRKKEDAPVCNQEDNQAEIQDEEKIHEPDLVKETPETNKIAEVAMFIADKFYDGRYTIMKFASSYRFCFGTISSREDIDRSFSGRTTDEAMCHAISFELTAGIKSVEGYDKSVKDLTKLADDRLAIIQEEQRRHGELEGKLDEREKEYKKMIKEKDDKLVAREAEYKESMRKNKSLVALTFNQLSKVHYEKQKVKEIEDKLASKEKEYTERIKEKDDEIIAKDVEYRKLMRESEDLAKLAGDRFALINEEKQKSKELEDKLASKENDYTKLMEEKKELERERDETKQVIGKFIDRWKEDVVMRSFEKKIAIQDKRLPDIVDVILESIEEMRHRLTKPSPMEEMKEKIIVRADELFSKGFTNLAIKNELSIYFPDITEEDVQSIREKWEQKIKPWVEPLVKPGVIEGKAERHPSGEKKMLAVIKGVKILEPVWNNIQDTIMDGEWHAFSEAEEIIGWHEDSKLTSGQVKEKRRAYFQFARDERYCIDRGGKKYIYKWGIIGGVNKFQFTIVGKPKLEEGGIAEVKKEERIEVQEGKPLGPLLCVIIGRHSIFKNPYDEFETHFCDDRPHHYSEMLGIFSSYERYNQYTEETIKRVIDCYIKHACNFYWISEKTGYGVFKTEGKKSGIERMKVEEAVPKTEEEESEEKREERLPVETLLPKGRTIYTVHHGSICRRIHEKVWNGMESTFMDGNYHAFPELERFFEKEWGKQLGKNGMDKIRAAYFFYATEIKHYSYERRIVGEVLKFRFEAKRHELEKEKVVKPEGPVEKLDEGEIEEKGLPLGKEIECVGHNIIFENPWNEFERVFCDGNEHLYSGATEMFRKYERYNRYALSALRSLRGKYFRHAYKYYRKEMSPNYEAFRFLSIEEGVEERIGEKEPLLESGPQKWVIHNHPVFENPWSEFETLFCDGMLHSRSEMTRIFKKYKKYNRYQESTLRHMVGYYSTYAQNFYHKTESGGKLKFEKRKIEEKKVIVEKEDKDIETFKESFKEKPKIEEMREYKPLGPVVSNEITKKIKRETSYGDVDFHSNPLREINQMLNESKVTVFKPSQIRMEIREILEGYEKCSKTQVYAHLKYFICDEVIARIGMLYTIIKDKTTLKILDKDAVKKVRETYPNATFCIDAIKDLTQRLNKTTDTVMPSSQIHAFFDDVLKRAYYKVAGNRRGSYLLYFRVLGMLKLVRHVNDREPPRIIYEIRKRKDEYGETEAPKDLEEVEERVPGIEEKKEYKPMGRVFNTFITAKIINGMFDGELKRLGFHFYNDPLREVSQMLNEISGTLNKGQIRKRIRDVFKNFEELENAPTVVVDAHIVYFEINNQIERKEEEDETYTIIKDDTIPKRRKKEEPKLKKEVKIKDEERKLSATDILGMEG